MTENKGREYCLIVEGAYLTEGEAEHALRDPFIEDWVEQTGHFKIHNMDDIQVTPGVTLGSLAVDQPRINEMHADQQTTTASFLDGRVRVVVGDITKQDTEAIVNAANSSLLGGGGVDGAIHRAGGPEILEECHEIRRTRFPEGLPTGEAVVTTGGKLRALYVIHTVGPIYPGDLNRSVWLSAGRGSRSVIENHRELSGDRQAIAGSAVDLFSAA